MAIYDIVLVSKNTRTYANYLFDVDDGCLRRCRKMKIKKSNETKKKIEKKKEKTYEGNIKLYSSVLRS